MLSLALSVDSLATLTRGASAPAADTTPDAFSFTDATDADLSTVVESNQLTLAGTDADAAISITGGEYQIGAGAWTSDPGTIAPGSLFKVRGTSSASNSAATDVVLTIGGVSDTFTITTVEEPAAFDPVSLFAAAEQGAYYDISDLSSLYEDSTGTTTPASVGNPVGYVADKSGNGNHLIQATSGAKPILRQDGSGNYYLEIDGVDAFISSAAGITIAENHYWCGAFQIVTAGGINKSLFSTAQNLASVYNSTNTVGIFQRSDGAVRRLVAAMRIASGVAYSAQLDSAFTTGVPFIGEAYHEGNTLYATNGATTASSAADDNSTSAGRPISVGGLTAVSRFYGGIALMRAATSDEKANVRAWLAAKAGVT